MSAVTDRLTLLAVVIVLVLSGCSAFGLGEPETETLTPVPLPSPEPTPDLPTVTPERTPSSDTLTVEDISRLGATYATRVKNDSYRLRSTQQLDVDGSVVSASTLTRRVVAGGQTYIERFTRTNDARDGTNLSYVYFYNGSVAATRYTSDATPNYGINTDPSPPDDLSGRGQLEDPLRAFAIERRSGDPLTDGVAFVGTRISNPLALGIPAAATDPRNGTLALRLYRNGTTTLRTRYTVTVDSTRVGEITRTFRVDRLGNVSASAPSWFSTARTAENASDAAE